MKRHRIVAVCLRYLYLYKRSAPRLMEIFYWPLLDLMLWGFITLYLAKYKQNLPNFAAFLLGALILWDILFRSQQGISVSFLEDVWSRNFLNLFASPLRPGEYLVSLMVMSVFKIVIAGTVMSLLAWLFYSFNFFLIGISLVPFILSLVMLGWAIGIVTMSFILRLGQEAEILAWGIGLLFQPVSAVFYPVSVLPGFLRVIARAVPSSYVFEGMRTVISSGSRFPLKPLSVSLALSAAYLAGALVLFHFTFQSVRKKGLLTRIGE
jgi:ABC-2 type transport system permease protein